MRGIPLKAHTRVVFMGNDFGLPTLQWLVNAKTASGEPQFDLIAIYTRSPKPTGRGLSVLCSPIHQAALELQKTYPLPFKIMTPETFKNAQTVEEFRALKPDLVIVGSYGLLLTQDVLDVPPMGCVNLHPSLLPKGRGPSPIQYAILKGEKETGLSIMQMTAGCDEGPVFIQEAIPIEKDDTADTIYLKTAGMAPELLRRVLVGDISPKEQDGSKATYTKKITQQDAQIDWDKSAEVVSCQIRALSSKPGAFTHIKGKQLKVYNALALDPEDYGAHVKTYNDRMATTSLPAITPGTILRIKKKLVVACQGGAIELTEVQLQNKNRISGKDFGNGHFISVGDQFTSIDIPVPEKKRPANSAPPELKKKIARRHNAQKTSSPVWWNVLLEGFKGALFNANSQTEKPQQSRE